MRVSESWIHSDGYRVLKIDGVTRKYSHYVWYQNTGYWPDWNDKKEVIHHINGDILDNRFENLQLMMNGEHVSLHKKEWHKNHIIKWVVR